MDEVEFADGFDAPEHLLLGLGAAQLIVLVVALLVLYGIARAGLPAPLTAGTCLSLGTLGGGLAWGRAAGRPLLDWAVFAVRFLVRPRAGVIRVDTGGAATEPSRRTPGAEPRPIATVIQLRQRIVRDQAPAAVAARPMAESPRPGTRPLRIGGAHRVVFFSLKGGTGRSALAVETACLLARSERAGAVLFGPLRVTLLDLDACSPSVAVRLGLVHATVLDYALAAPDRRRIGEYAVRHPSGAEVVLGPLETPAAEWPLNQDLVREVLRDLDVDGADVVIMDVAAQLSPLTRAVLSAADEVFVVVTATAAGVHDAYRTTESLRRLGLRHQLRYVVNRVRPGFDVFDTMADLDGSVIAEIPEDSSFVDAENTHALAADAGGAAAAALHRLARRIARELTAVTA